MAGVVGLVAAGLTAGFSGVTGLAAGLAVSFVGFAAGFVAGLAGLAAFSGLVSFLAGAAGVGM